MKNGKYTLVVAPASYPGKRYRSRYCYEHHLVWWLTHGSLPETGSVIHHKNGDHRDNRPENLAIMAESDHGKLHALVRAGATGESHGTFRSYKHGCRCDVCVAWYNLKWRPYIAAYSRQRRAQQKQRLAHV